MDGRKKLSITVCALILLVLPSDITFSFDWPMEGAQIVSTFGEDQWRGFLKAVELTSAREDFRPVEEGEIIFSAKENPHGRHRIKRGLGNLVILQHSRGIRSVYGHLKEVPDVQGYEDHVVKSSDDFAQIDGSGVLGGKYLYLQIIDSEVARFVNPLLSLPSIEDTERPVIEGGRILSAEKAYNLTSGILVPQGEYLLQLDTADIGGESDVKPLMAPYSIKVYINGEEMQSVSFESIAVNRWQSAPTGRMDLSYDALYTDSGFFTMGNIILQSGTAVMEVVVSDFAGNETSREYRIQVAAQ